MIHAKYFEEVETVCARDEFFAAHGIEVWQ